MIKEWNWKNSKRVSSFLFDFQNFQKNRKPDFRLTWYIEHRDLHVDGKYKVENTVEKLLSEKDSALDNRNQHDRNKDADQMAKVRSDVEQLRALGASQDAILATVIGKLFLRVNCCTWNQQTKDLKTISF